MWKPWASRSHCGSARSSFCHFYHAWSSVRPLRDDHNGIGMILRHRALIWCMWFPLEVGAFGLGRILLLGTILRVRMLRAVLRLPLSLRRYPRRPRIGHVVALYAGYSRNVCRAAYADDSRTK